MFSYGTKYFRPSDLFDVSNRMNVKPKKCRVTRNMLTLSLSTSRPRPSPQQEDDRRRVEEEEEDDDEGDGVLRPECQS